MDEIERQEDQVEKHLKAMVEGPHVLLTPEWLRDFRATFRPVFDELHERDARTEMDGEGWHGSLGGYAPVQGHGMVDDHPWYFRARWDGWRFDVGPPGAGEYPDWEAQWQHAEQYGGEMYEASWMPYDDAWGFIEASIKLWREEST